MIRSYLYAPASRPELIPKAARSGADAVVIDLEDAVAEDDKQTARDNIARFFADAADIEGTAFFVRINSGEDGLADVAALAGLPIAGIRLPKADDPEVIRAVSTALDGISAAETTTIECLIETARGVLSLEALAAASPRVSRFGIGASDYKRDIGARTSPERAETFYARSHLVVMSRSLGLLTPVAHVYTPISDTEGLERACAEDATLGFGARSCIHPSHVPVINTVFSFTAEEIEQARRIVAAYEDPETPNRGAFTMADGTFVDLAIYRRALDVVGVAE